MTDELQQALEFRGYSVWDNTEDYWTRERYYVTWADKPWNPVFGTDDPQWAQYDAIEAAGSEMYGLAIDEEHTLSDGRILFLNDPQVGVGRIWSMFDPEKELKPDD